MPLEEKLIVEHVDKTRNRLLNPKEPTEEPNLRKHRFEEHSRKVRNNLTSGKKMAERLKSNLPIPDGKENRNRPRIVRPVLRPAKLNGTSSSSTSSSPNLNSKGLDLLFNPGSSSSLPSSPLTTGLNLTLTSSCSGVEVISSTFTTVSSTLTLTSSTLTPSSSTLTPSSSTCTPESSSNTTPRPSTHSTPRPSSSSLSTPGLRTAEGLDIPLNNTVSTPYSQISLSYRVSRVGGEGVSPRDLTTRLLKTGLQNSQDVPALKQSRSPGIITSSLVPDIHNIILAKIKYNKRSSQKTTPNRSPCKAPAPRPNAPQTFIQRSEDPEDIFLGHGESDSSVGSISSSRPSSSCSELIEPDLSELDANFRSLFQGVDEYRVGVVCSNKLLDHLLSFVDLPQLDRWKIDELSRLLDPNHDNRLVDEGQFVAVGRRWAEMISATGLGHDDVVLCGPNTSEEQDKPDLDNVSYGSVEGLGGLPGCDSREVELENRCSELRYQLCKQQEDYADLQTALSATEEAANSLSWELDAAKLKISALSSGLERASSSAEEAEGLAAANRLAEERLISLTANLEEYKEALRRKDEELLEKEQLFDKLRVEAAAAVRKEKAAATELVEKEAQLQQLLEELENKDEINDKLEEAKQRKDGELEAAGRELLRLETELGAREDEIKNLTSGFGSPNTGSIHGANILDVSVDDKVLEEFNESNSPNPKRSFPLTPLARGPSASSTPARGRRGSIVEELRDVGFPSPLCGKGVQEHKLYTRLQAEIGRWQESVRRVIIAEVDPAFTGKLISAVNKVMEGIQRDILLQIDTAGVDVSKENEELRRELEVLKEELQHCKDELEKERQCAVVKYNDRAELHDIELVENRVTEMANLLQAANRALLAAGQSMSREPSRPTTPDQTSIDEDPLGGWQLDLEGIELIECNNNLSKMLLQYSKQLRQDLSRAEAGANTEKRKLWLSSLYTRLEDLQEETEKSRCLLQQAGESFREQQVQLQLQTTKDVSILRFPKTQSCQTEPLHLEEVELVEGVEAKEVEEKVENKSKGALGWFSYLVGFLTLLTLLLLFTFMCGVEYEGRVYYPITYSPFRSLDWVPAPRVSIRLTRSYKIW